MRIATAKAMPNTDARHPKRMPRDVPEHHPPGRAEMARDEWRFEDGPPVSGRRLGTHGFGRRHTHRATDGREGAGGAEGEDGRSQHHIQWNAEEQLGKAEELVVEVADGASEPGSRRDADDHAGGPDEERPFR